MRQLLANLSWRVKTFALCSLFLLITVCVGSIGGFFIYTQGRDFEAATTSTWQRVDAANTAWVSVLRMDSALNALMAADGADAVRTLAIASIRASSMLDEKLQVLSRAMPDDERVERLLELRRQIRPVQVQIIKAAKSGERAAELMGQIAQQSAQVQSLSEALVALERERAASSLAQTVSLGRRIALILAGIVGAGVLLGVLVSWFAARSIHRPLSSVERALADLAGGDLTITLKQIGRDEIGRTVGAISSTVGSLRTLVSGIQDEAGCISDQATSLTGTAESLQSMAEAVIGAVDSIDSNSRSACDNAQRAMSRLGRASSQASTSADTTSRASAEILQVAERFRRFEGALAAMAESTKALASVGHDIARISRTITEISDQTHMLAINATIEASHAGEQGRGFAVVAQEVRTLSGRTTRAVDEITTLVGTISSKATETVTALEQTLADASENIATLESVSQRTTHCSELAEAVNSTMGEVVDLMSRQQQAEEAIAASVATLSAQVQKSRQEVAALRTLSGSLSSSSADLDRSVSHFTLAGPRGASGVVPVH